MLVVVTAAATVPVFGRLIDRQQFDVDDLYTLRPDGRYHVRRGYNPVAIGATALGAVAALLVVLLGSADAAAYSWFIGAAIAFVVHWTVSRRVHPAPVA